MSPAYSPDIVVFKKDENTNLTGDYYISVNAFTYARYTLTYYLTGPQGKIQRNNFVRLTQGIFQKDVIYQKEERSKIYGFYVDLTESQNKQLTIILNRESGYFNFELFTGRFSNMQKIGNGDNILTIDPQTTGFVEHGMYFVKVNLLHLSNYETFHQNDTSKKSDSFGSFRVSYVSGDNPFALEDGLPIHYSFTKNNLAKFVFDFDTNRDFLLTLSDIYPGFNLYIDTIDRGLKYQDSEIFESVSSTYHVNASYFKEKCEIDYHLSCRIFIVVENNSTYTNSTIYSSFSIMVKHVNEVPMLFSGNEVTNKQLAPLESNYYYHYITKEDHGALILNSMSGLAQLFANVLNSEESKAKIKNWRKPTDEKHDFTSSPDYQGQMLSINKELVENCDPFCVLYFSVKGLKRGYKNQDFIEYSIKFETRVMKLLKEQPYHSRVAEGQYQFFTFKADRGIKNLYISLTTITGYCSLYMNMGEDTFPKSNQATWTGTGYKNSFIDVSENDPYLMEKITTIDAKVYTLGVFGHINSQYTIFVSTNPKKIIPVDRWKGASCMIKEKGQSCYFRDTTTFGGPHNYYKNWVKDILASTDFSYGSGAIYVKKYYISHVNIFDDLPSSTNYDWSSVDFNSLNFLDVSYKELEEKHRTNQNKNQTFSLIYAVRCEDNCLFEFNTGFKQTSSSQYLNPDRENIISVAARTTNSFYYYNYMDKNALIGFSTYAGSCNVKVQVNMTNQGEVTLADFSLNNEHKNKLVEINSKYKNAMIYIQITTDVVETELKIKIHSMTNFNQAKLGAPTKNYIKENEDYLGYFYFTSGFKRILITTYPLIDKLEGDLYLNIAKIGGAQTFNDFIQSNVPTYSNFMFASKFNSTGKVR